MNTLLKRLQMISSILFSFYVSISKRVFVSISKSNRAFVAGSSNLAFVFVSIFTLVSISFITLASVAWAQVDDYEQLKIAPNGSQYHRSGLVFTVNQSQTKDVFDDGDATDTAISESSKNAINLVLEACQSATQLKCQLISPAQIVKKSETLFESYVKSAASARPDFSLCDSKCQSQLELDLQKQENILRLISNIRYGITFVGKQDIPVWSYRFASAARANSKDAFKFLPDLDKQKECANFINENPGKPDQVSDVTKKNERISFPINLTFYPNEKFYISDLKSKITTSNNLNVQFAIKAPSLSHLNGEVNDYVGDPEIGYKYSLLVLSDQKHLPRSLLRQADDSEKITKLKKDLIETLPKTKDGWYVIYGTSSQTPSSGVEFINVDLKTPEENFLNPNLYYYRTKLCVSFALSDRLKDTSLVNVTSDR